MRTQERDTRVLEIVEDCMIQKEINSKIMIQLVLQETKDVVFKYKLLMLSEIIILRGQWLFIRIIRFLRIFPIFFRVVITLIIFGI